MKWIIEGCAVLAFVGVFVGGAVLLAVVLP